MARRRKRNPYYEQYGGGGGGGRGGGGAPRGGGGGGRPPPGVRGVAKREERQTAEERRSPSYAAKNLVRLVGRLQSTKEITGQQQERLGELLTGLKPKRIASIAEDAELPKATQLELVDTARQAQGMQPLPKLEKRTEKLTALVAKAAPRIERRIGQSGEASGFKEFEQAKEIAQRLPASRVKAATAELGELPKKGRQWRKFLMEAAGEELEGKGLGEAFAGAIDPTKTILGSALDIVGRPGQAVLGAAAEGPTGAWRGLTGQEQYTPIQSALRLTGQSQAQAAKAEAELPGAVRFPANIAGYTLTDPLTALSFGTSAAGRGAVRAAAPAIAAAGERSIDDITRGLTRSGLRSLSPVERGAVQSRRLGKLLEGAPGGVKVFGRSVLRGPQRRAPQVAAEAAPTESQAISRLLGLGDEYTGGPAALPAVPTPGLGTRIRSVLDIPERAVRPRAGIKQAARRGEPWAKDLAPRLEGMLARLEGTKSLLDRAAVQRLQNALRQNRLGSAEDLAAVRRGLDVGGADEALTARQAAVRDEARGLLDEALERENVAGIPTARLGEPRGAAQAELVEAAQRRLEDPALVGAHYTRADAQVAGLLDEYEQARAITAAEQGQYFPHMRPRESLLGRVFGTNKGPMETPRGGYTRGRQLEGSAEDINVAAGRDVFELDPIRPTINRLLESNRDVVNARFVDELMGITDDAGAPLLRTADSFDDLRAARRAGMTDVQLPGGVDVWVHEDIAADVRRMGAILSDDKATQGLFRAWDKFEALWKGYATVPAPFSGGFTFRNMFSNWFMASWMPERIVRAGPRDYAGAMSWQRAMHKGWKEAGDPFAFVDDAADRQMLSEALNTGVLDEGFYQVDLAELAERTARPRFRDVGAKEAAKRGLRAANPLSVDFAPVRAGRAFNSAVERNARLALFSHNYKTLGGDEAAGIVRKYLYDYNDLTPFERDVMRRIIPFYTWSRKTVPLIAEGFVKTPGRFSRVEQIRESINREAEGQETGPVPAWMLEQQGVVLPKDISNALAGDVTGIPEDTPVMFMPDLPYTTFEEQVGPLANLAAQVPGLDRIFPKGEGAGRALAQLLGNVGGPAGIGKTLAEIAAGREFFSGREFFPGQKVEAPIYLPGMPKAEVYAGRKRVPAVSPQVPFFLESAIPVLSKLRTLFPTAEADADAAARRRVSMVSGLNLWPLGPATRRSELLRRQAEAEGIRSEVEYRGGEVPETADIEDIVKARERRRRRPPRNKYEAAYGR